MNTEYTKGLLSGIIALSFFTCAMAFIIPILTTKNPYDVLQLFISGIGFVTTLLYGGLYIFRKSDKMSNISS